MKYGLAKQVTNWLMEKADHLADLQTYILSDHHDPKLIGLRNRLLEFEGQGERLGRLDKMAIAVDAGDCDMDDWHREFDAYKAVWRDIYRAAVEKGNGQ